MSGARGFETRTVAILGVGRVGSAIARRAIEAGYRVLVAGSGSPDAIRLTVDFLMPGAEARWAAEAAGEADLVILAVPFGRLPSLPVANLSGRIVLDAMNHWRPVDGDVPHLDLLASSSETVAATIPDARIVKSLNHIGYHEIDDDARAPGSPDRRAVAVASDDPDAATAVCAVVDRLGFDPVAAGPLANGVLLEPGMPIFGARLDGPRLVELLAAGRREAA